METHNEIYTVSIVASFCFRSAAVVSVTYTMDTNTTLQVSAAWKYGFFLQDYKTLNAGPISWSMLDVRMLQ